MAKHTWINRGQPRKQGRFELQEQTRAQGQLVRYRITSDSGAVVVMDTDDLFDLAELIDDMCDEIEDEAS
jgi:hypothetical protein